MPTLKTIQAEFDAFKRRQLWWQIGFAVVVVLFVVLWLTVFSKKDGPDERYKATVAQMDSTIKAHDRYIELLKHYTLAQDSALLRLDKQYRQNRPVETKIIYQYEKVPADVRGMDRERLRREVADF